MRLKFSGKLCIYISILFCLFPLLLNAQSVNSLEKVTLGGMEQWILVQGNDVSNPVLLVLHGGPGYAMLPLFHEHNAGLEDHFTIVNWDQRGAGRSYSANIPVLSMNLNRFLQDANELTQILKERFGQEKIYLLGHSWGTVLGMHMVKQFPDKYYAFIGVGQVVDVIENEQLAYDWALNKAHEEQNIKAIRALTFIGRPDDNGRYPRSGDFGYDITLHWVSFFGGSLWGKHGSQEIENWLLTTEEYKGIWGKKLEKGWNFSTALFYDKNFWFLDFRQSVIDVKCPVYFLMGVHDYETPVELVEDYFNILKAPSKEIVWFDNSAHFPFYEEPDKFNSVMVDTVKRETFP